ncbi:hypothetical protein BG006_010820 [Podila minutissima]|uniref:Uncharacterized protein n=1 Tax=Podila minutissima TaxID=64525 RepID=A0A9P5SCL9_9FUNG|nr:hypothetical protein BG006_010820 [Podila minutissima]
MLEHLGAISLYNIFAPRDPTGFGRGVFSCYIVEDLEIADQIRRGAVVRVAFQGLQREVYRQLGPQMRLERLTPCHSA